MLGGSFDPHLPQAGKGFFFMFSVNLAHMPESLHGWIAPTCPITDTPPQSDHEQPVIPGPVFVDNPLQIFLAQAPSHRVSPRTGQPVAAELTVYRIEVQAPSAYYGQISRDRVAEELQQHGINFWEDGSSQPRRRVLLVGDGDSMHKLAEAVASGQLVLAR